MYLILIRLQEILSDPQLDEELVNWQDPLGWIPLTYAAFHGDFELVKQVRGLQKHVHLTYDFAKISNTVWPFPPRRWYYESHSEA